MAREMAPDAQTLKGTVGSLEIEVGDIRKGLELLLPLTDEGNTSVDRGVSSVFVAKAYQRLGDSARAEYYINLAKKQPENEDLA